MVKFPNAKINLGLRVIKKRNDGYHELQTIFYPIAFYDALEILPALPGEKPSFVQTGILIPGTENENLCLKAITLLKAKFPDLPNLKIHLHKTIFTGAGLGGGSSDAAFTLNMVNELFQLKIQESALAEMALNLGSDCPFFLHNQPCMATGRGEKLTAISIQLNPYQIAIISPGIHISTGWAFSQIEPKTPEIPLSDVMKMPVDQWMGNLTNDFEIPVFNAYPVLAEIKQACLNQGAHYAAMSGSGSTIFGIFPKGNKKVLSLPGQCFYKWV